MTTDQVPPATSEIEETPRRWERLAPAGALVFLLTIILGALAVGESSPDSDGPARDIASYFTDHQGGHLTNTFLVALGATVSYPWFLASLWRALRRVEGDDGICATAALVGGITLLGPLLMQATAWGAAALQAGENRDPSVAAALFDLGNMAFILFPLPAAVMLAATCLGGAGTLLPRWAARAGLPLALVMVVVTWFGLAPLSFTLFGLWLTFVAVLLTRRRATGRLIDE
jgi:hypothetical protein